MCNNCTRYWAMPRWKRLLHDALCWLVALLPLAFLTLAVLKGAP